MIIKLELHHRQVNVSPDNAKQVMAYQVLKLLQVSGIYLQ